MGFSKFYEFSKDGHVRISVPDLIQVVEDGDKMNQPENCDEFADEMINLESWNWSAYKALWEYVKEHYGEDQAWKVLYGTWQIRAGELPIGTVS